jgi:hypothetical protein
MSFAPAMLNGLGKSQLQLSEAVLRAIMDGSIECHLSVGFSILANIFQKLCWTESCNKLIVLRSNIAPAVQMRLGGAV